MSPTELREHLKKFLGRLTRLEYLAIFAAVALEDLDAKEIAAKLAPTLKRLSDAAQDERGREFDEGAVEMRPAQIAELRRELPDFIIDLLIVDLEAFIHGFLSDAAGQEPTDDAKSLEQLVSALWPKEVRCDAQLEEEGEGRGEHWSYKELILLSEVRNSIVHGDGEVLIERSKGRLKAAGWTEEELGASQVLRHRSVNELLRFKRAVRTAANEVISSLERGGR